MRTTRKLSSLLMFAAGILLVIAPIAHANGVQTDMHLGRMWGNPENDGDASSQVIWPAGFPQEGKSGDGLTGDFYRSWIKPHNKGGTYMWSTNWTDPVGTAWPHAGSYMFRSMNYDYPPAYLTEGNAFNYVYPVALQEYYRYERPKLFVVTQDTTIDFIFHTGEDFEGGLAAFTYPAGSGRGPHPTPIIDNSLVTEKKLHTSWRYIMGVELQRDTYGWAYGTPHQDYIVHDMTMTNNGISGRKMDEWPYPATEPPVLTDQTVTGVIWARSHDWASKMAPGTQSGMDEDAMYVQPWGDPGYHAVLAYDGDNPDVEGPDYGDPAASEYYDNLLLGSAHTMFGPLFVSTGPGTDMDVPDLTQPSFRTIWYERGFDMRGEAPYVSEGEVELQRELMADGSIHLPTDMNYRDFAATAAVGDNAKGPTSVTGYGPLNAERTLANISSQGWTIPFNESVRIVNMLAASGIDAETGRVMGAAYNARRLAASPAAGWQTQEEIDLYKTGEDSVRKAAALAYWNFNGTFAANVTATELAAWGISDHVISKPALNDQAYNAPDGPRSPGFLAVYARADGDGGGIILRWGTESESTPNHDSGVMDLVGYRIYRTDATRMAPTVQIAEGTVSDFLMQDSSTHHSVLIPAGRYFIDDDVLPGADYWYAVVAYDDGSSNWAQPGVSLESVRWFTWSGYSGVGVTALAAGDVTSINGVPSKFALEQNAPNPFNPSTTIRFQIDAPGAVSLNIFNTAGQLVRTLVNEPMNSDATHEVVWDGKNNTGQTVGSGVYVYRLVSGTRHMQKRMVLVR